MEAVFPVIAIVLFVLYCKEYRKNKKMVRDYQYINARLLELADEDEINYILIPTDRKANHSHGACLPCTQIACSHEDHTKSYTDPRA